MKDTRAASREHRKPECTQSEIKHQRAHAAGRAEEPTHGQDRQRLERNRDRVERNRHHDLGRKSDNQRAEPDRRRQAGDSSPGGHC